MDASLLSYDNADEEYIDIEVSSHSTLFSNSIASPPHPGREFEFQMFSSSSDRDTTTSPADELFYRGKLLPLHLPPRLQMVEKLLHHNKTDTITEFFCTPLSTNTNTTPTANTPFESCNISPSESCQVSRELNPDKYFSEYLDFSGENRKKSWTRKIKLIKQSSIGSKLKASGDYLKSLFSKSGFTDEARAAPARKVDSGQVSMVAKEYVKVPKKSPFGQIQREKNQVSTRSFNKAKIAEGGVGHHRRSFSGAIVKRFSTNKPSSPLLSSGSSSSSSSSSSDSNGFYELKNLNRSCSATSEVENSIQAAIAHCKRAQQQFYSKKGCN